MTENTSTPVAMPGQAPGLVWQRSVEGNVEPTSTASIFSLKVAMINYHSLGPIYGIAEVSKNKQQPNIMKIPNAILQMAYMKLYIPLSMLTTSALSKIRLNDGLKYYKIPFGNGAGRQSLDESIFPAENMLSESLFLQAY